MGSGNTVFVKQIMIAENFNRISDEISQAAHDCGRDLGEVRLVVVTKGHSAEEIRSVIAAGARRLGENYVEEAVAKIQAIGTPPGLEWHMIGHVQSRKAVDVCTNFNRLHSLDSLKLAQRLDRFAGEQGKVIPALLECNVSGEESKFGWPAWNEAVWGELADRFVPLLGLGNLKIEGLMTMAPYLDEPERARPYFARLRRLREFLAVRLPEIGWHELSMGMSGDFIPAIQEGATLVRIGTAIMGPRTYS